MVLAGTPFSLPISPSLPSSSDTFVFSIVVITEVIRFQDSITGLGAIAFSFPDPLGRLCSLQAAAEVRTLVLLSFLLHPM